jgi:hypothetical protein
MVIVRPDEVARLAAADLDAGRFGGRIGEVVKYDMASSTERSIATVEPSGEICASETAGTAP